MPGKKKNKRRSSCKPKQKQGKRIISVPNKELDESAGEKEMRLSTVKLKLRSFVNSVDPVTGDPLPKREIIALLNQLVDWGSKISNFGGITMKRALIEYCECPDRLERYGSIGELLQKQSFYAQILKAHYNVPRSGPGGKEKHIQLVQDVRSKYYSGAAPFGTLPDRSLEGKILDRKAEEHKTNMINLYEFNLPVYQEFTIKAFLHQHCGKAPAALVEKIRRKIVGENVDLSGDWDHACPLLDVFINDHRAQLRTNLLAVQTHAIESFLHKHCDDAPAALVDKIQRKIAGENVDLSGDVGDLELDDDLLEGFVDKLDAFIKEKEAQLGFASLAEEEASGKSAMPKDFYEKDSPDAKDTRKWTKANLDVVVPYFYWMAKGLEEDRFGRRAKQADICPSYGVKMHHMVVDSTMFLFILRSLDLVDKADLNSKDKREWKNDQSEEKYWVRWYAIQRFEVNNERTCKMSRYYFRTDGTSASNVNDVEKIVTDAVIPREHEEFLDLHSDPNSPSHTDYQTGGADPGVVHVLEVAKKLANGSFGRIKLKLGHYRNDGLILAGQRADLVRRERVARREYHDVCSLFSARTVDPFILEQRDELLYHGEDGKSLYERYWREKARPCYREWTFRTWRASTRALTKFVASLRGEGEAPLILLYGNGSWGHRKGNPAAPNKKMLAECMRQHIVILVDEWMSSQTCPVCFSRFPKTVKEPAPGEAFDPRRHSVRGLLYCSKCAHHCYWDRDVVGARCIYIIGTTKPEDLPDMLRRELADQRPKQGRHVLRV